MDESQDNILKVIASRRDSEVREEESDTHRSIDEIKPHPNSSKLTDSPTRQVKLMSDLLKRQATPKVKKVLKLEIEVN